MQQTKRSWGENKSKEVKRNSKKENQTDSNNNQSVFETGSFWASANSNQAGSSRPNSKHSKALPQIGHTLNNTGLGSSANRPGSESCPEFRSGYRIQTKAYERRSETPPLSVTVNNRRYSNAYVDRLKQFYQDENERITQSHKSEPNIKKHFDNFPPVLNRPDMSTNSSKPNSNPKSSVDRLPSFSKKSTPPSSHIFPDVLISNNPRMTNQLKKPPPPRVTITLTSPSGKTSTPDDNLLYNSPSDRRHNISSQPIKPSQSNGQNSAKHESVTIQRHTPKYRLKEVSFVTPSTYPNIPPPVPILIAPSSRHAPSAQSLNRNTDGSEINHSDSLTLSDTQSILEAVQTLGSRRSSTAALSSSAKNQQRRKRLSRAALEKDSKNLAMKMSLPCRVGCCYCVYASLLGPVKIYLTRGEKPKKEPWLLGIKDGHGRPVIPVSRKEDITGLVYDAHNHSFHPPSRGQRPMFPSSAANKGTRLIRTPVSKGRSGGGKHGGT